MEATIVHWGYSGKMENDMETTSYGLGFRFNLDLEFRMKGLWGVPVHSENRLHPAMNLADPITLNPK